MPRFSGPWVVWTFESRQGKATPQRVTVPSRRAAALRGVKWNTRQPAPSTHNPQDVPKSWCGCWASTVGALRAQTSLCRCLTQRIAPAFVFLNSAWVDDTHALVPIPMLYLLFLVYKLLLAQTHMQGAYSIGSHAIALAMEIFVPVELLYQQSWTNGIPCVLETPIPRISAFRLHDHDCRAHRLVPCDLS